ncbi:GNAT family N-acetyltransferase [Candidatus Woesearchaeota archaeon]|nr:GNAT family N-acetyltransferase [Candidatus Woesearchaeota archaeon]
MRPIKSGNMEKITANDLKIERIRENHEVKGFKSYEQELVDFLLEDALNNQHHQISVTYLLFLNTGELIGYVTLLNDRINLEGDLKDIFRKKGIGYHSLPALKIGRLCVDDRFLRRGIGTIMIDFSIKVGFHIFEKYSGCRFILLDAKRNYTNDPIHFYKKLGFKELKERKKGTTPMYLDLVSDIKLSV